jgi:hypothetical protein
VKRIYFLKIFVAMYPKITHSALAFKYHNFKDHVGLSGGTIIIKSNNKPFILDNKLTIL